MQTLDVGEIAYIDTDWYDADGSAHEPSAITLTIHPPSGADIVKTKADMTGSESGAEAGTNDRWTWGQVVNVAGLWRYDAAGVVNGGDVALPSGIFLVGLDPVGGPCEPWCSWSDVIRCGGEPGTFDAADREAIIDLASSLLFDLSGRRYTGVCERTIDLCLACTRCAPRPCACGPNSRIDLGFPVWGAWDITLGSEVLAPSEYRVVDRRWLVRLDEQPWPTGSDVVDPTAFRLSYAYGRRIPLAAREAAARFAHEIALACAASDACSLPQRVTQITREGVSFAVLDPMTMMRDGRTGIYLVDMWLTADERGRQAPASLFNPNARQSERSRA